MEYKYKILLLLLLLLLLYNILFTLIYHNFITIK